MKKPRSHTPVESLKHKDTRANIPTEELRDFVADEEKCPKTVLYPRDQSLDPQLVWKGKDEQDTQDLAVPCVPVYIQEKIHPQALVENLRDTAKAGEREPEIKLFEDFNGIEFEKLIDFYQHEQHWSNRMILGDSLLVMTSLAEKEGLKGKVQMIYIDPPYGIKFGSNWQVSTRKREVKDGKTDNATRQPEQIKAFRDTWKDGINSYLAYLRDRLVAARELLTESGSVFVQIGDENVHLVRCLMDEVFGNDNFRATIPFKTTSAQTTEDISVVCDYLLWYHKSKEAAKTRKMLIERDEETLDRQYDYVELADGTLVKASAALRDGSSLTRRRVKLDSLTSQHPSTTRSVDFVFRDRAHSPQETRQWGTSLRGLETVGRADRLVEKGGNLFWKRYADEFGFMPLANLWMDTTATGTRKAAHDKKIYAVQTMTKVIARCVLMTTDPGDLVLDPTCGSGTTAHVAEQWGRRWITVDTSRVALALARTRLMAGKFPYYLLADSPEGQKKEMEITGIIPNLPHPSFPSPSLERGREMDDIKKGFVYKRVPHITLKSIANNEEIDTIHAKWQEKLEPIRAELNALLGRSATGSAGVPPASLTRKNRAGVPPASATETVALPKGKKATGTAALPGAWEEWQIPREADKSWTDKVKQLHAQWWELRRKRQKEIDDSIARRADTELLYDQPYEDNKRIRVTGPFTVESLSPHRVLSTEEERPESERAAARDDTAGQFVLMIIENLKKAGVQNTVKNERLKFDRLESFAGAWLHATGEYTEKDGAVRRVAVSIGPEHGTVGPEQVKEAAKEALKGVGFDLLIICGFAFDAHVGETVKQFEPEAKKGKDFATAEKKVQYGKLPMLLARINADLEMGEEFLKKTGAGNLFMVFGEPDVEIKKQKDGKLVVKVKGVDVYDPTTGEIRSHTTDDIACWFIDTNYNGESFFVRHAYFTGADEPYEKLKRALKAEIDESAWASLYSTESRPFDPPTTGKIAVKVINHYGDEVLKVYEVRG